MFVLFCRLNLTDFSPEFVDFRKLNFNYMHVYFRVPRGAHYERFYYTHRIMLDRLGLLNWSFTMYRLISILRWLSYEYMHILYVSMTKKTTFLMILKFDFFRSVLVISWLAWIFLAAAAEQNSITFFCKNYFTRAKKKKKKCN